VSFVLIFLSAMTITVVLSNLLLQARLRWRLYAALRRERALLDYLGSHEMRSNGDPAGAIVAELQAQTDHPFRYRTFWRQPPDVGEPWPS
jgi:hypothetical protein